MEAKQNQYIPEVIYHPGETLNEKLQEMSMGPKEFSVRTNKPEKTIIAILKGESSITPEMAVQFEHVLNIPAHFWLNLQGAYNEYQARVASFNLISHAIEWAKQFPVNEMMKLGWIAQTNHWTERTSELFSFFGISNPSAWEDYYCRQKLKVAFRISLSHTKHPHAISAWLRHGDLMADQIEAGSFSEAKLKQILPDLKQLMIAQPAHFFKQLQQLCLRAGVKVIYSPTLPKTPISGSTRWIGTNPVVQLSGRYKRNDIFWFTFFHEIGHVLLHGKKEIFLEGSTSSEGEESNLQKEREADEFAIFHTFSKADESTLLASSRLTEEEIVAFAKQVNTHPALIFGRLQHLKHIAHYTGKSYFVQIHLEN